MGFTSHSQEPISEKIILAHIEPSEKLTGAWTQDGGDYYITADHFVVGVDIDGVAGTWTFDASNYRLTITTAIDPNDTFTNVTYRLFFSNLAINLPYDLASGAIVPYRPIIQEQSIAGAKFDKNDIAGISVEGKGKLSLFDDDFWVDSFDRLSWQNKAVRLYAWGDGEEAKLYDGLIRASSKNNLVTFQLSNLIYKFRSEIDLPLFTSSDGDVPGGVIGKPKRRIYGRVQGLDPQVLDPVKTSYNPNTVDTDDTRTGTAITSNQTLADTHFTASDADIADEIVSGDEITIGEENYTVKSLGRSFFGLDETLSVSYTFSGTDVTVSFTGMDTTNVTVGDFIVISPLVRASTALNARVPGIWAIDSKTASSVTFDVGVTGVTETLDTDDNEIVITDETNLTRVELESDIQATLATATIGVNPLRGYRRLNRSFNISHHALHETSTTVSLVYSLRHYKVGSIEGLEIGDGLTLVRLADGAEYTSTISELNASNNEIRVDTSYAVTPLAGDTLKRTPVQQVYHDQQLFTQSEDYTVTNTTTGADLLLDTYAEREVATEVAVGNVQWVTGSRAVLGSSSLLATLQPRDWIKPGTGSIWYEISEIASNNIIILTTAYSEISGTIASKAKLPSIITDSSKLWVDTYGVTDDGEILGNLVRTAADVIKHLLTEIDISDRINTTSFSDSNDMAPYLISLALPLTPQGKSPKIRDVVNKLNTATLSNLFFDNNLEIVHVPLTSERLETDSIAIDDTHALTRPSLTTDSTKIYKKLVANYNSKDLDLTLLTPTTDTLESESDFVTYSGTSDSILTKDYPLFFEQDTRLLADKRLFIAEKPKSLISFQVPLEFNSLQLNSLVVYTSDRLFKRAGTGDQSRLGIISSIQKNGKTLDIEIDDVGNIFTRQAVIGLDTSPERSVATSSELRWASHITDDNGLISNDSTSNGINLIG